MNRKRLAIPLLISTLLASCQKSKEQSTFVFSPELHLINDDFDGLGVEWGAYEDTNKLQTGAWDRITNYADHLRGMSLVRCMVSYDWFCQNLDTKGDTDKTNDTWEYNFDNKWMRSTEDILSYCQAHDINVAFGAWNVIADLSNDTWGMLDDLTSDPRWAKMNADILEYLVIKKGYTCIKYVVNSNEPNFTGTEGQSKNALNTFAKWKQGVLNVRHALDEIGLNDIKVVGSDATVTTNGSFEEYIYGISQDDELKNAVGDYGIHVYAQKKPLDDGTMLDQYRSYFNEMKSHDSGFGNDRKVHIWEGGLVDFKDAERDCQTIIDTYNYATIMANYTLTSLASGVNGITFWDFDDGMHFMYNADGRNTPKEWGMFSTLSESTAAKQQLRPWYHSSSLLINLLKRHNVVFDSGNNGSEIEPNLRSLATISNDKNTAGVMFSNTSALDKKVKFVIDQEYNNNEKMYVYLFNEKYACIGEDGFVKPNYEIEGTMSKITEINIPGNCFVVVSNEVL